MGVLTKIFFASDDVSDILSVDEREHALAEAVEQRKERLARMKEHLHDGSVSLRKYENIKI